MESLQKLVFGTWKVKYKFHGLAGLFVMAMLIIGLVLTRNDNRVAENRGDKLVQDSSIVEESLVEVEDPSMEECDFFNGEWVYDNKSYPLYNGKTCPFMVDTYACEKFGRKDLEYQYWRWQPFGCELARFNGTLLLEKLRNKRVVFVGDSLGRNQWVSLLCMIDSWILDPTLKISEWHSSLLTFKAIEYNVSIDFYWEPLLVESNGDDPDPVNHRVRNRVIRVESIESHARNWVDADILIFDSYLWWLESITLLWGSSENPTRTLIDASPMQSFELALKTWSSWLEQNINRTKTRLFFTSPSPFHKMAYFWGGDNNKSCYNETEPILDEIRIIKYDIEVAMMQTMNAAIEELKNRGLKVQILNVTQLSTYRKDGHPSIYKEYWQKPSEIELEDPNTIADCVHWCLPGVPDVWNEIFYSYIIS